MLLSGARDRKMVGNWRAGVAQVVCSLTGRLQSLSVTAVTHELFGNDKSFPAARQVFSSREKFKNQSKTKFGSVEFPGVFRALVR